MCTSFSICCRVLAGYRRVLGTRRKMDSFLKLVCGLKCSWIDIFGRCLNWKLFMLKPKKEQYKTDKDWPQLNRLEHIDNHTWYFASQLKSSFEACCWGWGWWTKQEWFLFLPGGLAIWRGEQTQLKEADWCLHITFSTFTQSFRHCIQLEKELHLWDREFTWKRLEDLKTWRDSFIYFLWMRC